MPRMIRVLLSIGLIGLVGACVDPAVAPVGGTKLAGVTLTESRSTTGQPSNPAIRYGGGDGSSLAKAVVIQGARGEADGVQSEYDWIAMNLPGWRPASQALLSDNKKTYDALTLRKGGESRIVYFDISAFFGKF